MDFRGKVCVITGGANGIGRCIVQEFLKAGANVAFIDTDEVSGSRLMQQCQERLLFVAGDITEESVLRNFAEKVISRFGRVDCLVNNACLSRKGILSGCGFDDFNYVLRLGVTAPYMLSLLLKDVFTEDASIVNISSTRATMSQADTESYTAAKGGISALTHALAISLAGRVRVNSVSPGWIDTGAYQKEENYVPAHSRADRSQHPAGRVGVPEDIAKTVLFLCSGDAGFITGQNIVVDGGMTKLMIYDGDAGWAYSKE